MTTLCNSGDLKILRHTYLIETFHWRVEFDAKVNGSFKGICNTLFYDLAW